MRAQLPVSFSYYVSMKIFDDYNSICNDHEKAARQTRYTTWACLLTSVIIMSGIKYGWLHVLFETGLVR